MKKLWILILCMAGLSGYAQDEYDTIVIRDLETWSSATFQVKFNKKLSLSLSPQLRLQENSSHLERYFADLEMEYKLNKNLEFSLGYRFLSESKNSGMQWAHRYNIDGKYKFEINRFDGYLRLRYQSGREFGDAENTWENHFRLKTKIGYNIKDWKIDPYISGEIFRLSGKNIDAQFDKMRFTVGSSYKFNKKHSISFFYGGEKQLNTTYPKTTYIVGLGYKFTFKPSKNDK